MATDYVTSPTHKGMLIYGVGIGLLTVIIRVFGGLPGRNVFRHPDHERIHTADK